MNEIISASPNSRSEIKKDLQGLKTNRQFLTILILLFVSILFWISISLITSQSKEEISKELTNLAKPLIPNFDRDTLLKIQDKHSYTQQELSSFVIYKILVSRNGKDEKVVPIEVTIDDIEPKATAVPLPKKNLNALLESEDNSSKIDTASESSQSQE
ncbi:hypothetical protein KA111_02145 [Candidatus Woesebacteria bacterium]|nr:hypothetical protein [Candidatus Woesebacteria bacterium]